MESRAKCYEAGIKFADLNDENEVNQLYFDSLKAKMALLEQL